MNPILIFIISCVVVLYVITTIFITMILPLVFKSELLFAEFNNRTETTQGYLIPELGIMCHFINLKV